MNQFYKNSTNFNILLLDKTEVGKNTLINGTPITQKFYEFSSKNRKGLILIDSKGIEMEDNNINTVFNSVKHLKEEKAREGDLDILINCLWYCLKSDILLFEDIEKKNYIFTYESI